MDKLGKARPSWHTMRFENYDGNEPLQFQTLLAYYRLPYITDWDEGLAVVGYFATAKENAKILETFRSVID